MPRKILLGKLELYMLKDRNEQGIFINFNFQVLSQKTAH